MPPHDVSSATIPPAFKLDDYLLWRIFITIADSEEGIHRLYPYHSSALHTIRRGSQVCRYWRDVILNSPSLWASVVNLTHLQQKTDHWRDVVLRRSGTALLTVTGAVDIAQSLLFILDTQWKRIRKLDVVVYDFRSLEDERWKALQQPAPCLESFRLGCARGTPLFLQDASSNILFADYAPLLHEFSASQINFLTLPPWFAHIRVLHISSCFTMPQLLDSLVDAHFLEWLDVQNGFTPVTGLDRFRELPVVVLPRLSRIQIRSNVGTCLDFLEQIQPVYGCSLALQTDDPTDAPTVWGPLLLDKLRRIVSRYSKAYFSTHNIRELSLDIQKGRFRFSGYADNMPPFNSPECHYFNVWINSRTGFTPTIVSLLFNCLASCPFTGITSLIFKMVDILDFDVSDSDFVSFISSLPNVEVLQTGFKTIALLNGLRCDAAPHSPTELPPPIVTPCHAFPLLKTVKIQEIDQIQVNLEDVVTDFFRWRNDSGVRIESLELMIYGYVTTRTPDLSFLEYLVPGMEVVWRSAGPMMRYVCGEGNPNKLVYSPSSSF
ncbi:hypothetical protein BDN70DRAFT_881897 [Pholiota conissans]|uniref:F-box domain-containing protein n=1 Tax=Pholiota conissans TaxID=109636 RepID=A0A9P5YX86_9AGAR|nr:hypothetical protein BDN70DRAFT_881897 [Pholiota conissans]